MPSPIMRFFAWEHLSSEPLKSVSHKLASVAYELDHSLPDSAEKSAGLRKLLEAKDCFVRAALPPAE